MATTDFINAYLKKRYGDRSDVGQHVYTTTSGANKSPGTASKSTGAGTTSKSAQTGSTEFTEAYLKKRYGESNDVGTNTYSTLKPLTSKGLNTVLERAQALQTQADKLNNLNLRKPSATIPDYAVLDAESEAKSALEAAAIKRQDAAQALYGQQIDLYGPYLDSSGQTIERGLAGLQMEYDVANQAYEDAFADYQKKQAAANQTRAQEELRQSVAKETEQYNQVQAQIEQTNTDAQKAWSNYYKAVPKVEDYAQNSTGTYSRATDEERLSAVTDKRYGKSEEIRDEVLTDEERGILNYLENTLGEEAAQRYYQSIEDDLNARWQAYKLGQAHELGQDMPVTASAASSLMNLKNELVGGAYTIGTKLSGGEIDPNADAYMSGKIRDAMREGVMKDMGPVGQFVYQTAMSAVADSTLNAVVGSVTGTTWVGATLTGLSSMTDTVRQVKEEGGDDTRAMVLGIVAGIAEMATEKMGFDRLADMLKTGGEKTLKQALTGVLADMASEAMEEGSTTVINQMADVIYSAVAGEESEFSASVAEYQGRGLSMQEAVVRTIVDMTNDVELDALGGALGGLMMGGGTTAISQAFDRVATVIYNRENADQDTEQQSAQQQSAQQQSEAVQAETQQESAEDQAVQQRIAALAQETADEELSEQRAAVQSTQTERAVKMTGGEQTAVRNAAQVYGKDASSFESHYTGGDVNQYRRAFDHVYQAGKVNLSLEQVNQAGSELVRGLSGQAKLEIWQAGRNNALNTTTAGVSRQYTQTMDSEQRAQVRLLDAIGKKYGVQIDVVDSLDYGSTRANAATVGKNHIVVAADAMEHAYVQAGVHELVHVLKQSDDDAYHLVSDLVVDVLERNGVTIDEEIANRIEEYAQQGVKLTQEEALEEIVAESVPVALSDKEAMKTFVQENRTVAEKIRDFFVEFAKTIEELAEKYFWKTERKEVAAMLLADTQELKQIAEALDYALSVVAEENAQSAITTAEQAIEEAGLEVSDEGVAYPATTETMYSLRTLSESDYVKERDKAAEALSKKLGVDLEQAQRYIDDLTSVGAIIAADKARLDFEAEGEYSSLKHNSEYKWTVDMSTLCAKRLTYTGTFDAIQTKLNNEILTADDYIQLRNMMAERGYEVACAFCYVESRRKDNGRIISEFLKVYKDAQESGDKMVLGPSNRRKQFSVESGFTPTIADFNTTDGVLNILHNHRGVYDAYMYFMNARGTSKPKLIETRTEYRNEILSKFKSGNSVRAMNKRGGLRLQSFSDFEVVNLLDMMQITYDMSRVGLSSQAYTKVPAFARVFGGTGIKINESLVTSGVDENGKLIFDDVEGMPHEEAFRIREMYPENVGTILVGRDDASILAAMEDHRIDFIIPYHRSGWDNTHMASLGIAGYTDYTKYQNEKPRDGKGKISNFFPLEYWDFSRSGDENAEIYLKKCEESGRIPKFPQFAGEPGYWKMLIDFKMYDNAGNGSPQRAVRPDINMEEARKVLAEYKGGHRNLPVANDVVRDFIAWHEEQGKREISDAETKFSLRQKEPPEKTLTAYKVFVAFENKPGQLFPPMVANPNGESTPVGVWLDADEGVTAKDKNGNEIVNTLGRKQVKAGGKGTQGGSGALAYRPGWHLGELPMAKQFARVNPETGVKELFPANFVWAECEIAADKDYQEEAMSYGYNKNGKFQHSLAGLPKLPTDGYYMYRTNPDPTTLPWYITGAMKVTRILNDAETDQILREHGIEPMARQGGPIDLERFGLQAGEVQEAHAAEGQNDVRFSLVNTSKVEDVLNLDKNLALPEDVKIDTKAVQLYARDAMRAAKNSQGKINQQVRQVAGRILKDTASRYKRSDLESNLRAVIAEYAKNGPSAEVTQQIAAMSKAIIEGNEHLDNTIREHYADLRERMRKVGVTLSENQRAEAASIYGSYKDYRDALMGTVTLRKDGATLDSVWGELSEQYPEFFERGMNDADQINALVEFKRMMEPRYVNDFGMGMDAAATDLGLRIQADIMGIIGAKEASKSLYGMRDQIERKYKKAYDAQLRAQKQERVQQFQQIAKDIAAAKKAKDNTAYQEAMQRYRELPKTTAEKRVAAITLRAERDAVNAARRERAAQFQAIRQAMTEARKAHDEAAYQAALEKYRSLEKSTAEKRVAALAVAEVKAQVKANMKLQETERKRQAAVKRVTEKAHKLLDVIGNRKKGVRVPRMLQDTVLGLLESIDLNGKKAEDAGERTTAAQAYREQLQALRYQYQAIWDSQSKGEAPEELNGLMMTLDERLLNSIKDATDALERGKTFYLRAMDEAQLKQLEALLTNVRHTIETIGKLWRSQRYQSIVELGNQSMEELSRLSDQRFNEKNGAAAAIGRDFLTLDMMEPVSFGERLGEAGNEIINNLVDGERIKFARLREAQEHINGIMQSVGVTSYDVGKWKQTFHTFRLGDGHVVKMTVPQIMDVYNARQRPQANQHLLGGGMRLSIEAKAGKAQVFTAELTDGDMDKMTGALTAKQRAMAVKMQKYLAADVAKWGNDVTQQLYLFDFFTDTAYWPATSDPNALKTEEPRGDVMLTAITSPGWMKEVNPKASNPLVIRDAFDVFNQHVAEMASYSGLAMPIMDALSYLNYSQRDANGKITAKMRESIERVLGKGGTRYMTNLIADLNHARKGDDVAQLSKLSGAYKKSAVVGKIRVTMQQPTAIARAAQEISPAYLVRGIQLKNKADIEEMQKYSALAWWKSNGSGADIGVGHSADRVLWGDMTKTETALEKVATAGGLIDAAKADDVTWAAMWRAVKQETSRLHPELEMGSEAYYRAVADRFDRIMDRTQVVDSVMHRSQVMRSNNALVRELTSFMAEPIKSYNMLARAGVELSRNPKSENAQKNMVRAGIVFAANAALTALATALFDVFKYRDDDDDLWGYLTDGEKGFLPEYLSEFTEALLDNMNVIELVPILRDLVDAATKGDSPEMMSFEGVASLFQAANTFKDHFIDGNKKQTTLYGAIAPTLKAVSSLTGLPIAGAMANMEMMAKIANPQALNYKLRESTLADDYEALYEAMKEGDTAKAAKIRARLQNAKLGSSAKSTKEIDRGVAYVLAEKDERVMQCYQMREAGNQTKQLTALKKEIMADGFSDAIVTAAINRCESLTESEEAEEESKDLTEELTAKMYGYDDLYNVIRNGTLEDVGIVAEYLEANSSAKDPAKSLKSNVGGEFKSEYVDGVLAGRNVSDLKNKLMSVGYDEDDLADWVKDARYDSLGEAVGEGDVSAAKKLVQALEENGTATSNIVSSLNNRYKQKYIDLVEAGMTTEAAQLQKTLESLGLVKKTGENYFRKSYMDSWVEDYLEEQNK